MITQAPGLTVPARKRSKSGAGGKMELTYKIILSVVLAGSVYTDLRWRLIKNWLVFPVLITGPVLRYIDAGLPGLVYGLKGMLAGFFMIFIPYLIVGGLGAGDVKLMAAIGVLTGPYLAMWAALFASLYGALISLIIIIREKKFKETISFTVNHFAYITLKLARGDLSQTEMEDTGTKIAYAVPITLGVITASLLLNVGC